MVDGKATGESSSSELRTDPIAQGFRPAPTKVGGAVVARRPRGAARRSSFALSEQLS